MISSRLQADKMNTRKPIYHHSPIIEYYMYAEEKLQIPQRRELGSVRIRVYETKAIVHAS
jgi:hypothetical protein